MKISLKLTCMSGMQDGESFQFQLRDDPAEVLLGRSEDCTVSFPEDPELSRRHARLLWNSQNAFWQLEDLKSTNGTYLGEFKEAKRVGEPVALTYSDIFRVGRTCLRLEPPLLRETETAAVAYAEAGNEPSQSQ